MRLSRETLTALALSAFLLLLLAAPLAGLINPNLVLGLPHIPGHVITPVGFILFLFLIFPLAGFWRVRRAAKNRSLSAAIREAWPHKPLHWLLALWWVIMGLASQPTGFEDSAPSMSFSYRHYWGTGPATDGLLGDIALFYPDAWVLVAVALVFCGRRGYAFFAAACVYSLFQYAIFANDVVRCDLAFLWPGELGLSYLFWVACCVCVVLTAGRRERKFAERPW